MKNIGQCSFYQPVDINIAYDIRFTRKTRQDSFYRPINVYVIGVIALVDGQDL